MSDRRRSEQIRAEIEDLWQHNEGDLGTAAHVGIEVWDEAPQHPHCETPRHRGEQRTAVELWILTKYNYGDPAFIAMCQECHERMYSSIDEPLDRRRIDPSCM